MESSMEVDNGDSGAGTSGITVNTENGHHHDPLLLIADGEVSPSSLRRSTRASALKAQEKLKFKDGMGFFPESNGTEDSQESEMAPQIEEVVSEPKSKKPRLLTGKELDQYDCKFGIRMDKDDIYVLTDESEISSLNDEELGELRRNYEEFIKAGVSADQQFERDAQIRQLESDLRLEENKLVMLKKTQQNQKEAEIEALKRQKLISDAAQRQQLAMGAYRAPVAANPAAKVNGTTPKTSKGKPTNATLSKDAQNAILNMDPAQQKAFMQKLVANPALAQQAQALLGPQILQLLQQQQQNQNIQKSASSNSLGSMGASNLSVKKETPAPAQTPNTPAQRANEARRRLRQHLEQQLVQIPHPKPVVNEINFIPNPTNEFCYLVGLDLVVQRVLKDRNVFKKYEENPYVCEECGTDFTPSWKAIGQDENDLHLYCEACVRQAQKKKMKADHAAVFKKAFAKIAEQEKELEKQIAAGKFDEINLPPPPPAPKPVTTPTPAPTMKSSSSANNLSNMNVQMLTTLQLLAQQQKKAAQQSSQPSTSTQAPRSTTTQNIQQQQQQKVAQKRPATSSTTPSSSSSSSNNFNPHQMLLNFMRQNPMMATLMTQMAGQMGTNNQLWANLMSNAGGGGSSSRSGSSVSNNMNGSMALFQAMLQQQQQQHGSSNNNPLLAMMNNPFLAQMMAMQNSNMRNLTANKTRK
ncbi:hypothetical protein FO519_001873 [Halicephalobus sp. NKZ332]|nr:hypothetical protein FO519_001873 [Halicephalobus sp. NKZ332]